MYESSKSIFRTLSDARYATRYLVGDGIDVGSGNDFIGLYAELFPLMRSCRAWDAGDGDAQLLAPLPDRSFDFVLSSHCLEHMRDVHVALKNWLRVLKPQGHLICTVPDEDLYEQGVFPSTFNPDHKHTFTIHKKTSWSKYSINLFSLLESVDCPIRILKVELLDATYRYNLSRLVGAKRVDQTQTPVGECAIEFIVQRL
jgi:SAM-dependent methyltransferase